MILCLFKKNITPVLDGLVFITNYFYKEPFQLNKKVEKELLQIILGT